MLYVGLAITGLGLLIALANGVGEREDTSTGHRRGAFCSSALIVVGGAISLITYLI